MAQAAFHSQKNFLDYSRKLRDFSSEGLACSIFKVFLSFSIACSVGIITLLRP
jgi:hypothetical protein